VFQQNLASWQNGEWRFRSCGTWCYITGPVVLIISSDHSASSSEALFDPEDTAYPRRLAFLTSALLATVVMPDLFFSTAATYCQGAIPLFSKVWCSVWHLLLYSSCRMVCWYHTSSAKHTDSVQSGGSSDIIALFNSNDLKGREVITSAREAPFAYYTDAGNFKVQNRVQSPDSIFSMAARLQDGRRQQFRSRSGQEMFPLLQSI